MNADNDAVQNFFSRMKNGFPAFRAWFTTYLRENWIKVGGLGLSATQTYVMLAFFAPSWAWWLPVVGIAILEGGVPYWEWREETADYDNSVTIDEKGVEKKAKNAQAGIANMMVWISLFMSAMTMVAGVFIEVTQSQLSKVLTPNAVLTNVLGWAAITGIFLLVTINLFADWRYKREDPLLTLERENRQLQRQNNRTIRAATLNGENKIAEKQAEFINRRYSRASTRIGYERAQKSFSDSTVVVEPKPARKQRRKKGDANGLD